MTNDESSASEQKSLDIDDVRVDNGHGAAGRQRATHMGFLRTLATIIFIIALPVALLTSNIRLLFNAPPVYDYAFDRYDAEERTGLSRTDLDRTGAALRDYWNNDEKTFYFPVTEGGLTGPVFGARETTHMEDVKAIVVWLNRIQEITVVFVLAYIVAFFVWLKEANVRHLAVQSLVSLGLGVLVIGSVGVFAIVGFDAAFERFHQVLFPAGNWQFNSQTDHLIQMFPEAFWRDVTIFLGILCAAEAAIIAAISTAYLVGTRGERRRLQSSIDVSASGTQAA